MQYVTCDKQCVWFAVCVQVVRMVCKAAGMQFTDTELHTSIYSATAYRGTLLNTSRWQHTNDWLRPQQPLLIPATFSLIFKRALLEQQWGSGREPGLWSGVDGHGPLPRLARHPCPPASTPVHHRRVTLDNVAALPSTGLDIVAIWLMTALMRRIFCRWPLWPLLVSGNWSKGCEDICQTISHYWRLTYVWWCWQTPKAKIPSSSTWPENLNRTWIWSQIFSGTMFVFSRNVAGCVMTKQCWATWMAA